MFKNNCRNLTFRSTSHPSFGAVHTLAVDSAPLRLLVSSLISYCVKFSCNLLEKRLFITKGKWACVPLMKSKYKETWQVLVTVMDELHQRCLRTSAHASHLRIIRASTVSHTVISVGAGVRSESSGQTTVDGLKVKG